MIDINKTLDLIKFKFYNEWLYTSHLYDEGDSNYHKQLTTKIVEMYIDPLNLPKQSAILDMGCGPGYFLDVMKERGYTNMLGITLSEGDVKITRDKGHNVKEYDISFLPQKDGFNDETIDFIFCRQTLEHSPYPIFTLIEYNRVLKQGGKIYIEMPAPDQARRHEYNPNHYSILGHHQLAALLERTGFGVNDFNDIKYDVTIPADAPGNDSKEDQVLEEKMYCVVATKLRPLDIK